MESNIQRWTLTLTDKGKYRLICKECGKLLAEWPNREVMVATLNLVLRQDCCKLSSWKKVGHFEVLAEEK